MIGLFDREGHLAELAAHRRHAGELDDASVAAVNEHLAGCDDCRGRVERLAAIVAAPLPPLRLSRPAPARAEVIPLPAPRRRYIPALVGVLALAAGLVLGLRVPLPTAPETPETFTPRGAPLRLEVFRDAGGVSERLATGASIAAGDRLAFRIADAAGGHLLVVGLDGAGEVYPVWPPDTSGSRPSAANAEAVQLDAAIAVDATPGAERIVAVRCPEPVAWAELATRLAAVGSSAAALPTWWAACAQDEVRLEKQAPEPKGP